MKVYVVGKARKSNQPANVFSRRDAAQAECDRLNAKKAGRYAVTEMLVAGSAEADYSSALAAAQAYRGSALEAIETAFFSGCSMLFNTLPELQSFCWSQFLIDDAPVLTLQAVEGGDHLQCPVKRLIADFIPNDLGDIFGVGVAVTISRDRSVLVEEAALCPDCLGCE